MANKEVDELQELINVGGDYLLPVFNVDSTSSEKLMKVTSTDTLMPKHNPSVNNPDKPAAVLNGQVFVTIRAFDAGANRAYVTAADFIISIQHNDNSQLGGGPPYTYGIRASGDPAFNEDTDPRKAIYEFTCSGVAPTLMEIKIQDSVGNFTVQTAMCVVEDVDGICAAP